MDRYRDFFGSGLQEIVPTLRDIVKKRIDDVNDFTNLKNIYVSGRSVKKIPATSADVGDNDRVGDVSYALDGSYKYELIDNAGTAEWRRIALGSF